MTASSVKRDRSPGGPNSGGSSSVSLGSFWLALVSGDRGLEGPMAGDQTSVSLQRSMSDCMGGVTSHGVDGHLEKTAVLVNSDLDLMNAVLLMTECAFHC